MFSLASAGPDLGQNRFPLLLLRSFMLAAGAFYFALKFIFPGHFHPLAAHHSDMYMMSEIASNNWDLATCWSYSRPVLNMAASAVGALGFEGGLIVFTVIVIIDIALVISLFEVYFLRRSIPSLLAFLAALIVFCSPGFYIAYSHDLGAVLAMFFGLLGIWVMERAGSSAGLASWLWYVLLCLLSALSKESFVPALAVYGTFVCFSRLRSSKVWLLLAIVPVLSAAVSFFHSHWVGSTFVNVAASATDSYHISLNPVSLYCTALYYLTPLLRPAFVVVLLIAAMLSVFRSRGLLFLGVFLAGASLFVPYIVLPNHTFAYYWWGPMPFWVLLLLTGLLPSARIPAEGLDSQVVSRPSSVLDYPIIRCLSVLVLLVGAAFTLREYRALNKAETEWHLIQQDINRNLLSGIRLVRPELATAKSVLVLGVDIPFHPWIHPDFLREDLPYNGLWYFPSPVAESVPVAHERIRAIDLSEATLQDADLVVAFAPSGIISFKCAGKDVLQLREFVGVDPSELSAVIASPKTLGLVLAATGLAQPVSCSEVALKLYNIQCPELAERFYVKALRDGKFHDAYSYFFLGKLYMAKARYSEAANCFERAIEYDSPVSKNFFFAESLEQAKAKLR